MRKRIVTTLLSFLLITACLVSLPSVSATHSEVVVPGDHSYQLSISLNAGQTFVFGWSSTQTLNMTFSDPSEHAIKSETDSTNGGTLYKVPTTGTYTITWSNDHSTDATLTIDYFPNAGNLIDAVIVAVIVGLVVIAVVVVVIVWVVLRRPKTPQRLPMPPQPPQYQQPPPPPSP